VLTLAFSGLTIFYALLSLPGFLNLTNQAYFYFVQIFIGIFNAFLLPCMIGIMGNWFPKKNRGIIVGLWATCNNFGNIVGIQLAAFLMDNVFNNHWQYLMVVASALALIFTFTIYFFLIPHPEQIGITVEEMTEKEILIAAATQKDVYENVIRNSIAANAGRQTMDPEEVQRQVRLSGEYNKLSIRDSIKEDTEKKITFFEAWMLPRVMLYSSAFFCTKMAVYCLLLLLPSFLSNSDFNYSH
jgi:MFS family permease